MPGTFEQVLDLIRQGDIVVSHHGYDELAADEIAVREAIAGTAAGVVIEDYPSYPKGPCVLVLQRDRHGQPIHVVWGIPKNASRPAVLVTAYRPDPGQWRTDYLRRKT
jgi:hypothetical protein